MASRRVAFGLIVASVGLVAASVLAGYGELGAQLPADSTLDERMAAIVDGTEHPGRSFGSRNQYLDTCLDPSASLYFMLQPSETYLASLSQCGSNADAIAAETPTLGKAWLASAAAAAGSGDLPRFHTSLRMAAATAPYVHFLADGRVALLIEHLAQLDASEQAMLDSDLATLLQSAPGAAAVGRYFVAHPDLRARITGIAERGTAQSQTWFLAAARTAAAR